MDGRARNDARETTALLQPDSRRDAARARHDGGGPSADDDLSDVAPHAIVGRTRAVLVVLGMTLLIVFFSTSVVGITIAQSAIAADLDAFSATTWFTSIVLTVSAALTPLLSRLAGVFSPTALVLPTTVLLAAGALVSGLASSLAVFLLGRVLAGVACAGVLTLGMCLVLELVSPSRRGVWIGLLHTAYTVGVALGAVVFGSLLDIVGWRALLWAQAPLSILGGLCVYLCLPSSLSDSRDKSSLDDDNDDDKEAATTGSKLARLDYIGAVLLTSSFVLFLSALDGTFHPVLLGLCVVSLGFFVLVEFRFAADPLIPLSVLTSRGTVFSCFGQMGLMSARWLVLYFVPIVALGVRGLRPSAAGALLVPTNLGFSLGGILVGWIHVRAATSYWGSSVVSILLSAAALLTLSPLAAGLGPVATLAIVVFTNGFVTGAAMTYTVNHSLYHAAPGTHAVVAGCVTTFRSFGGSLGMAVGGAVFSSALRSRLLEGFTRLDGQLTADHARLVEKLMGSPALAWSDSLDASEHAVAVDGYADAAKKVFWVAAALAIVSSAVQAGTGRKSMAGKEDLVRGGGDRDMHNDDI